MPRHPSPQRPPVSLIVPFHGSRQDARAVAESLDQLHRGPGDELIIADNTSDGVAGRTLDGHVATVLPAGAQRSSYFARNVGAEAAGNDWLLFMDADCRPGAGLLDEYFSVPLDEEVGAVAGAVTAGAEQDSLVARWTRSRGYLDQEMAVGSERPYAVTANLLVRRSAWASVGGFLEGVRSGADSDFCWRLQEAGWHLEYRAGAGVEHRHRERLGDLVEQVARYGGSRAWLHRRYGTVFHRPAPLRRTLRALGGVARWTVRGDVERARLRGVDALVSVVETVGYLGTNRAPAAGAEIEPQAKLVVFTDRFPESSETFVAAEARTLAELGRDVRVEALARAYRPDRALARALPTSYLEDDSLAACWAAVARLLVRHPVRSLADRVESRRWKREEAVVPLRALAPAALRLRKGGTRHLHVHFAAGAALGVLRMSRLLRVPYSLTAHAYDIYREPRNLEEKLRGAAFVTSGCEYTVADLRRLGGARVASRTHEIVMGVDGGRFKRQRPYPGGHTVVGIGRLVEKKGFSVLVDAIGRLRARELPVQLQLAGGGPLTAALQAQVDRLELGDAVELLGPLDPSGVFKLLEAADVLAMPSVIAADGDRDSMPVVVKEALAMEVPVVASDEVGLPELVKPGWGRLAPPGDADALADALAEVLALAPDQRAAMGRAGREWVLEHCDVRAEAGKLARLIDAAADDPDGAWRPGA